MPTPSKKVAMLAQLTAEPWAMLQRSAGGHMGLDALFAKLQAADEQAFLAAAECKPQEYGYRVVDGVAVFEIAGKLLKDVPDIFRYFNIASTSTLDVQEALAKALDDSEVDALMFHIDSPGGQIAGIQELADDIRAARDIKPVHAHISDLGASAAYWLASQAGHVTANGTAEVGGIGIYMVVFDSSKAADEMGVTVHVIKSGKFKGVGISGAPITDEQIADLQRTVDGVNDEFIKAVAAGRGVKRNHIRHLATGQVWLAEKARQYLLIDEVANWNQAFSRASGKAESPNAPPLKEADTMATVSTTIEGLRDSFSNFAQIETSIGKAAVEKVSEMLTSKAANIERERCSGLCAALAGRPEMLKAAIDAGDPVATVKVKLADVQAVELAKQAERIQELEAEANAPPGNHSDTDPTPEEAEAARVKAALEANGPKDYAAAKAIVRKELGKDASRKEVAREVSDRFPDVCRVPQTRRGA